jgi:hypothetical protein
MDSDKPSAYCTALHAECHCVFESFKQSVTLNTIYRQTGQSPKQVAFRDDAVQNIIIQKPKVQNLMMQMGQRKKFYLLKGQRLFLHTIYGLPKGW